jgi:protein-S-isoprenylcysteine O-methyltransferase Ste14
MADLSYRAAAEATAWIALTRCAWVLLGILRTWRIHRRARTTKWGWVELSTLPEPVVLFVAALVLRSGLSPPVGAGALTVAVPLLGAALSLGGLAISLWSFYSFPNVGTGHYVESDQRLITTGAYGLCRHPIYLGVYLIWFGLAASYFSVPALVVATLYVVPIYVLYMRSEEKMMLAEFGDQYVSYCQKVGMVLPRFWPREAGA